MAHHPERPGPRGPGRSVVARASRSRARGSTGRACWHARRAGGEASGAATPRSGHHLGVEKPPVAVPAGNDLELRLLDEDDAVALQRAIDESRDHLVPFMPFATTDPSDLGFRRSWIGQCRGAFFTGQRFQYGIIRADEVIGGCSIDPVDDRTASIGFWVHVEHVRRGVASAVATALTQVALEAGYEVVRIRHDRANAASGSIAARLGYERIGEEPHSIDAPGQTGTSVVWTLTRTPSTPRST